MRKYRDSLLSQVVIERRFNPYTSSDLKTHTHNMLWNNTILTRKKVLNSKDNITNRNVCYFNDEFCWKTNRGVFFKLLKISSSLYVVTLPILIVVSPATFPSLLLLQAFQRLYFLQNMMFIPISISFHRASLLSRIFFPRFLKMVNS